eukprot:Sspe_Gene.28055::Locus_12492_Transcript_3_3_Confidence_0.600_Length_1428::g.28055::m.28055/K14399/CLP1, HERB; polyribonucleotide 5'-hydroxyl-kinase
MSLDIVLAPGNELRFEVGLDDPPAKVKVLPEQDQFAEVFGAELAPGTTYDFAPGTNAGIYTWHGCRVNLLNLSSQQVYKAEATPMQEYAQAHSYLEQMRRRAAEEQSRSEVGEGPRVLVCGPPDSGKAALCRILVNYATRLDWQLTYVDVDVANNTIAPPGSLAAVHVDTPVPIAEGFSMYPPLTYYFGDTQVEGKNEELYFQLLEQLGSSVRQRQKQSDAARCGGVIVRAMSPTGKCGLRAIQMIIKHFNINTVLLLGDDKLHAQLSAIDRSSRGEGDRSRFTITKLPRSGGCVSRSPAIREKERARALRAYFKGWDHMKLHPHRFEIRDTKAVTFVKVGSALPTHMDGLLPIGEKSSLNPLDVTAVTPNRQFEHLIIALSQAKNPEEAAASPIYGFAQIVSVDEEKNTMELLIPAPDTELPSSVFVVGEIRWLDM